MPGGIRVEKQQMKRILTAWLFLAGIYWTAPAQHSVRPEDNFHRRRMVYRMDMQEKINQPFVRVQDLGENQGQAPAGLVSSLLGGLEKGLYPAYLPDQMNLPSQYSDVLARMQEFDEALTGIPEEPDAPWQDEDTAFATFGIASPFFQSQSAHPASFRDLDLGPYEQVIQWAEDQIFDEVKGQMLYRPAYIQLVWTDPGGALPEKILACFKWTDVSGYLDQTPFPNRFNEAETRTMKQAFEMRMFHAYIISVSGQGVMSLGESEHLRKEQVAFEHHLWSY